jgi:3-oxoacyl-[acyl-carrier-protein] synthase-3
MQVSIVGYESFMPEREVGNDFFDIDSKRLQRGMFAGAKLRRHVDQETCSEMLAHASRKLIDRFALDVETDIDLILTNVSLGDQFFSGHGLILAKRIGAKPKFIYDLENSGCVSFVYMAQLAQMLVQQGMVKTALIGCVQASGGRIYSHPDLRDKPQASIPGDGCGVAYLRPGGESPILSIETRSYPEYSEDMEIVYPDGRKWWEPGAGQLSVKFDRSKIAKVITRGNALVPEAVRAACHPLGIAPKDLDFLVTNQPNTLFLRNWREALELPVERHLNTFKRYGNLFGAAIPVTLSKAIQEGKLFEGARVCLAGFSHAGDYAGALIYQHGLATS